MTVEDGNGRLFAQITREDRHGRTGTGPETGRNSGLHGKSGRRSPTRSKEMKKIPGAEEAGQTNGQRPTNISGLNEVCKFRSGLAGH